MKLNISGLIVWKEFDFVVHVVEQGARMQIIAFDGVERDFEQFSFLLENNFL